MDAADRRTGEVKDLLYTAGVRNDEHVHLEAFPSAKRDLVMIAVYPNHWRCEDCRSRGLVQRLVQAASKGFNGAPLRCSDCRIHEEANAFHARAKLTAAVKALQGSFTLLNEHATSYGVAHMDVKV